MNRSAPLNPLSGILDGARWTPGSWLALVLLGLAGLAAGTYAGLLSHAWDAGPFWQATFEFVAGLPALLGGLIMIAVLEVPVSLMLKGLLVVTAILYVIADAARWRLLLAGAFFAVAAVDSAICVHAVATVSFR